MSTAAISLRGGSTGIPKGVVYNHGHFVSQVELIRRTYKIEPGEIDLPTFPLFALFIRVGTATMIPDMDLNVAREALIRRIIEAI